VPGPKPMSFVVSLALGASLLAACSGGDTPPNSASTQTSVLAPHASGPTPAPGDTALLTGSQVLQFDVPNDISCVPDVALVEVSYATRDLDAVGFVVDGVSVATPDARPDGTTVIIPVPCDGTVHTIMLVGSGAGGPAFASKAVVTRPA
jgi:hypothetical protein